LVDDFSFEPEVCVSLVAVSLELSLAGLLQAVRLNAMNRQSERNRTSERIRRLQGFWQS
jgi:hypothetical protein